jgi:hypothetical protein
MANNYERRVQFYLLEETGVFAENHGPILEINKPIS